MDLKEVNKVLNACKRAQVTAFKWGEVEIYFDKHEVSVPRQPEKAEVVSLPPEVLKKNLEALDKLQQEVESEMNIINDPLAWEMEATSGKE